MPLYEDIDLLTTSALMRLPPAEWLVQGLIPKEGFAAIYGAPASAKSFVALDWAMCVSEGRPWLGRVPVQPSPVVYIAAEGGRGIKKRVAAWMQHYGYTDLPGMYWLLNPLYIREEGTVEAFLETLEEQDIWPGMIVLDTLSRSFGGGDENASTDMGNFVDRMTELAGGRRMACLVIHHSNATGQRERGHTAFKGAVDTMFRCSATRNDDGRIIMVELQTVKQKDDEEAPPVYLRPVQVTTGTIDGQPTGSIVLEETEAPEKTSKPGIPAPMRTQDMLQLLNVAEDGLTWGEWRIAANLDKNRFNRRIKRLTEEGHIYRDGQRYYRMPAGADLAADDGEE